MPMTWEGTRMVLPTPAGPLALRSPLIGAHNVSNMMAAVAGGLLLSVPPETVAAGIAGTGVIPGRLEADPNARALPRLVWAPTQTRASEDPGAILAETVPGLTSEGFVEARGPAVWREGFFRVEADRKTAIAVALSLPDTGDT